MKKRKKEKKKLLKLSHCWRQRLDVASLAWPTDWCAAGSNTAIPHVLMDMQSPEPHRRLQLLARCRSIRETTASNRAVPMACDHPAARAGIR
jgi:hypothetical protein